MEQLQLKNNILLQKLVINNLNSELYPPFTTENEDIINYLKNYIYNIWSSS